MVFILPAKTSNKNKAYLLRVREANLGHSRASRTMHYRSKQNTSFSKDFCGIFRFVQPYLHAILRHFNFANDFEKISACVTKSLSLVTCVTCVPVVDVLRRHTLLPCVTGEHTPCTRLFFEETLTAR